MSDDNKQAQVHNPFLLGNRTYDFAKKLVQIILPAFSALYFGLASIWDLPYPDKVVGTVAVITTFLGVCLGISSAQYAASGRGYDGNMLVIPPQNEGDPKRFHLELNGDPQALETKESITFKVKSVLGPPE